MGRSQSVLGCVGDMLWLVPDHFASDLPPDFSHRECDSPRNSQPFLSFALVIEIEPVASRGPCDTVQLPPDGREGFNIFLHGLFASDFVDRVADVPTSAVGRRACDGAIHGIIGQSSEHFTGISKQEPALPACEERRCHVRRNHGYIHTFLQPARRAPRHAPRSLSSRFFLARTLQGFYLQKSCMRPISSFASFSRGCVVALIQTCILR